MFLNNDKHFTIQFNDATFLKQGEFHGFIAVGEEFFIGKTANLKEAVLFSDPSMAPKIAHDLSITEPFKVKEVEVILKLK